MLNGVAMAMVQSKTGSWKTSEFDHNAIEKTPTFGFEYSAKWKTQSWKTNEFDQNALEKNPSLASPSFRFWVQCKME